MLLNRIPFQIVNANRSLNYCETKIFSELLVGILLPRRTERRFLHFGNLLPNLKNSILPVAYSTEPGKRDRECRVFPTTCDPRAVMKQTQCAQRFNQVQLSVIKFGKGFVATKNCGKLGTSIYFITRQQHPEILDRWPRSAIVKINKMRAAIGPQNIPYVAVTMKSQHANIAGTLICGSHSFESLLNDATPRSQ